MRSHLRKPVTRAGSLVPRSPILAARRPGGVARAGVHPGGLVPRSPILAARRRGLPNRQPVWTDRWAVGLAALAVALNAGLALVLWRRFDTLPELVALHYNAFGEVDLIGGKNEIFKLPLIGTIVWAANAALAVVASPVDRVLARVALGVGVLVQVLFAGAVWRILS